MKTKQQPLMNERWALNEHNNTFLIWFKKKVYDEYNADTLLRLVDGPNNDIITYEDYDINNFYFYSTIEDDKST